MPGLQLAARAAHGNGARRARRFLERLRLDFVGIGEAGALAGHRAHAHSLLDAGAAFLDDAVLERPGLLLGCLEIQIRGVDLRAQGQVERLREPPWSRPPGASSACCASCRVSLPPGAVAALVVTVLLIGLLSVQRGDAMRQRRKFAPCLGLRGEIDVGRDDALASGSSASTRPSSRRSCCGPGAPAIGMQPLLGAGHEVTQILDGARAQQRLPVRLASGRGERRWHHQPLRARCLQARYSSGKRTS